MQSVEMSLHLSSLLQHKNIPHAHKNLGEAKGLGLLFHQCLKPGGHIFQGSLLVGGCPLHAYSLDCHISALESVDSFHELFTNLPVCLPQFHGEPETQPLLPVPQMLHPLHPSHLRYPLFNVYKGVHGCFFNQYNICFIQIAVSTKGMGHTHLSISTCSY